MRTRRVLPFVLSIALTLSGCQFSGRKSTATPVNPNSFVWGMSVNLFPYPALHDEKRFEAVTEEQIRALKQLKVQAVRFTYSIEEPDRSVYLARRLQQEGIRSVVILEDYINGPEANETDHGYQFAKTAISHVGQYVDYYQLANEIGGTAIKSAAYPGTQLSDYDPTRLNQTLNFVSGASRAVHDFDPTAARIISINSLETGIIKEAINRHIDFEIIGWNWFSDFGTNLDNPLLNQQTGERYPFLATLRSFGKPLWLTELSRRGGAADNHETAQADFLKQAIPIAVKDGFKGIFPFNLVEDVVGLPGYGLLEPQQDKTGAWYIARPRVAFFTYQTLIKDTHHD